MSVTICPMGAFLPGCTVSRSFRSDEISSYQRYVRSFERRVLISLSSRLFDFSYIYLLIYFPSVIVCLYVLRIFPVQFYD